MPAETRAFSNLLLASASSEFYSLASTRLEGCTTSGVGKTETARILSDLLAPGQPLPKINFGNYSSNDSLNSLIGSPRGYIGSEEGELSLKIEASESSVILIDEFEKTNPAVWNFFLDLLESGHFTDSQGAMHGLDGYTIVFTSNAPKEEVRGKFPPELLSRFGLKARFAHYSKKQLVRRLEQSIAKRTTIDASPEGLPIGRPRTAFRPCPKRARGVLPTRAPLFPTTDRKLPGLPPR